MNLKTILTFFLIVNALGFLIMQIDKNNSINGKRRISEASIFTVGVIGGSIGIMAGMYILHHKTRKKRFTIGMPIIFVLQILMIFVL